MPPPTPCPDPGALRAALDGERPDVRAHVDGCQPCKARSAELSGDAGSVAAVMAGSAGPVDVERALARHRARTVPADAAVAPLRRRRRMPDVTRVAAAVVVLMVVAGLVTPAGRAAADALLSTFRAESIQVVPVDVATVDLRALEGLLEHAEAGGLDQLQEPREVSDLAEAAQVAGFLPEALDPDALPEGLRTRAGVPFEGPADAAPAVPEAAEVSFIASAPQTVRIAFDDGPGVPQELVGTTLVLDLPGVVLQTVGGDEGVPAFVRGEAGRLAVAVEGGRSLGEVRDALLELPGLPPETVASLRAIEEWETTLPLPVPVGSLAFQETTVDGHPGIAFGDETGSGSVLLWSTDERFVGVGGFLPLSEVRRIAEAP